MIKRQEDVIVQVMSRILIPFIQLYALYVLFHGHDSPGGGFQGGCILAASFILMLIAFDIGELKKRLSEPRNIVLCSIGVLVYSGTGFVSWLLGGNFLDYARLGKILFVSLPDGRHWGMFFIELGVWIAVSSIMAIIFVNLLTEGKHEEADEE